MEDTNIINYQVLEYKKHSDFLLIQELILL